MEGAANTLAYYDTATIMFIKSFIVHAQIDTKSRSYYDSFD
jgi:hypothetical protein